MKIKKPYQDHARQQVQFPEPSLTKQAMKSDSDINNIMAKYHETNLLSHVANFQGIYGDFTNVVDYHTALNGIIAAGESFASLPSHIRVKFNNDAGQFMDFVHDPKNADEMVSLGLREPSEPNPVPPATEPPATPPAAPETPPAS